MAVRVQGQITGLERSVQDAIRKLNARGGVNLRLNDRGFTQPLGRITAQVSEFNKSIEASNARVIAFGASVGILNAVKDAFEGIVRSTVRVEKALADVNIVLNASQADLKRFSKGLFDAARNTGQSFNVVTNAATEFARQGLSIEETLRRTNDALILTRLTGMDAAESVQSLTAAMNTFSKAGLTSTQVISKMAAVDVEFAVSADDLAAAISRTGQSAVEAGVSIDQLIGLVTAAQQRTARGGAVIGNAFKTILTRIRRPETLQQLEDLGIAVRDVEYNTLPAVQILNNLAATYDRLSDAQKSQLGQTVAGVFQINILKAALADASSQNSILARATQIAAGASDEAVVKNQKLNQTLDALGKQTVATFTEVAKSIGDIAVGPGLKNILQVLNSFGESITTGIDGEGAGAQFFQGFLRGIGNVVTGPGLVVFGGILIKLFANTTKFASSALKDILGITTQAQRLRGVQEGILQALGRNTQLQQALLGLEGNRTAQERVILELIKQQTNAMAAQQAIAQKLAPTLARRGVTEQLTLPARPGRRARVPNLSATTYAAPNFSETNYIPNFTDLTKLKPNPTQNLPTKAHPEFAGNTKLNLDSFLKTDSAKNSLTTPEGTKKLAGTISQVYGAPARLLAYNAERFGAFGSAKNVLTRDQQKALSGSGSGDLLDPKKVPSRIYFDGSKYGTMIPDEAKKKSLTYTVPQSKIFKPAPLPKGVRLGVRSLDVFGINNPNNFKGALDKSLNTMLVELGNELAPGKIGKNSSKDFNKYIDKAAGPQLKGRIFESTLNYVGGKIVQPESGSERWDFPKALPGKLNQIFGITPGDSRKKDAKFNMGIGSGGRDSMIEKIMLEELGAANLGQASKILKGQYGIKGDSPIKRKGQAIGIGGAKIPGFSAWHYEAPNFSAVGDAIKREVRSGVPRGSVRIATHSSLKSPSNPRGMGVFNRIHEPKGLSQGIRRARSEKRNPRTYGMPNFAEGPKLNPFYTMQMGASPRTPLLNVGAQDILSSTRISKKTREMAERLNAAIQRQVETYKRGEISAKTLDKNILRLTSTVQLRASSDERLANETKKVTALHRNLGTAIQRAQFRFENSTFGLGMQGMAGGGMAGALGRFQSGQGRGVAARLGRGLSGFGGMGLMIGGGLAAGALDQAAGTDPTQNQGMRNAAGALQGASTGAAMGMMLGPIGIAAGASVGALMGLVNATKKSEEALREHAKSVAKEKEARDNAAVDMLSSRFSQLTSAPETRQRVLNAFQQGNVRENLTNFVDERSTLRQRLSAQQNQMSAFAAISELSEKEQRRILFGSAIAGKSTSSPGVGQARIRINDRMQKSTGNTFRQDAIKAVLEEFDPNDPKSVLGKEIANLKGMVANQPNQVIASFTGADVIKDVQNRVVKALQENNKESAELIKRLNPEEFILALNKDINSGQPEFGGAQAAETGLLKNIQKIRNSINDAVKPVIDSTNTIADAIGKQEISVLDDGKRKVFNAETFKQAVADLSDNEEGLRRLLTNVVISLENEANAVNEEIKKQAKLFDLETARIRALSAIDTTAEISRTQRTLASDILGINLDSQLNFGQARGTLTNTGRATLQSERNRLQRENQVANQVSQFEQNQASKLLDTITKDERFLEGTAIETLLREVREAEEEGLTVTREFIRTRANSLGTVQGSGKLFERLDRLYIEEEKRQKAINDATLKKGEAADRAAKAQAALADLLEKQRLEQEANSIQRQGRLDRQTIQNRSRIAQSEALGRGAIELRTVSGRGLTSSERLAEEQALETSISNQRLRLQRDESTRSAMDELISSLQSSPAFKRQTAESIAQAQINTLESTRADVRAKNEEIDQERNKILATAKLNEFISPEDSSRLKKLDGKAALIGTEKDLDIEVARIKSQAPEDAKKQNELTASILEALQNSDSINTQELEENLKKLKATEQVTQALTNTLSKFEQSERTADESLKAQRDELKTRQQIARDLEAQRRLVSGGVANALGGIREELQGFGAAFGENTTMSFLNNLERGLNDVASGSKNAKEAFLGFANGIFQEIQRMLTRRLSLQITEAIFGGQGGANLGSFYNNTTGGGGGFGGGFISNIGSGIKTFGRGVANFIGLPFNDGGIVPAMVQGGEYLFSRDAVRKIGANNLNALNQGMIPKFATGGRLSSRAIANPDPELGTIFGLREQKARQDAQYAQQLRAWKKARKRAVLGSFINTFASVVAPSVIGGMTQVPTVADTLPGPDMFNTIRGGNYSNAFNRGGLIKGGSGVKDDIPMILQGGEFVMRKSAVEKYGRSFMDRLNGGMNEGGYAGTESTPSTQQGASTGNQTPSVTININLGEGAETSTEGSSSNQTSEEAQQNKEFAQKIKTVVLQTIREEQRVGGTLNKKNAGQ